jgi:hypothetical protein
VARRSIPLVPLVLLVLGGLACGGRSVPPRAPVPPAEPASPAPTLSPPLLPDPKTPKPSPEPEVPPL